MNKQLIPSFLAFLVLAGCTAAATDAAVSGPRAWIDAPLDGSTFEIGEVEIISHAADISGIAEVELSANGAVQTTSPVEDGSALITLRQTWTPASEGEYQISVRAKSVAGVWSAPAQIEVTIGDASTPTPEATATPVATATPTSTPEPTLQPRLRYFYTPDFISAGGCFKLEWTGQNVSNVIVQGNPKPDQGSETFCPTSTTVYTLSADSSTGKITHQFTMVVNQASAPAASATPTSPAAPPPPAPPAVQLPSWINTLTSGGTIENTPGCGGPSQITITANFTGATSAVLNYMVANASWRSAGMASQGGNAWAVTLRQGIEIISSDLGVVQFYVTASNAAGSINSPTLNVITVLNCKP